MKIKLNQNDFYQGIQTVNKAVSDQTKIPILSGILLRTKGNKLKLVGTNLEIGIEYFVEANIIETGDIVLPAKYLTSIIRALPNKQIKLTTEPTTNTCQIKCRHSQFNIHGSAADEFPLLPEINSETTVNLSQNSLKKTIKQVEFAVANNKNKPLLTGGLLTINKNSLQLVATDTYRLAYREKKKNFASKAEVVIPHKTLIELKKLLNNSPDKVEINLTDKQILFKFAGISIISRLIEGQFPNYQQVIPDQTITQIVVNKNQLLQAAKRAALLTKNNSKVIKLDFKTENLIITSKAPEIGQAYEEVPISVTGPETEIAVNASYLLECLQVINVKEVIIELSDSLSPGIIKTNSEDKYIYVIMPVRSA